MLYFVPTPIGNLGDITRRAVEVLQQVGGMACEDTRRLRALLTHLGIPCPSRLTCYREHFEQASGHKILEWLEQGLDVALCSDAGFPGISDPGYRLSCELAAKQIPFTVLPGASSVHVALLLSGLPTSSYLFKGYPPRKPGALHRFFAEELTRAATLICFESPYRIRPCLQAALDGLGDRQAAVCLELTKKFERVERGYLSELVERFSGAPTKGEAVLVVAGDNPKFRRGEVPPEE